MSIQSQQQNQIQEQQQEQSVDQAQFPQLYYSPIMGMMNNPFASEPMFVPAFMGGYFELYF